VFGEERLLDSSDSSVGLEHWSDMPKVVGSIPTLSIFYKLLNSVNFMRLVYCLRENDDVR
jgi:hypothetical protein